METVDTRTFKEKVKDTFGRAKVKVAETYDGVKTAISEHPVETFTLLCLSVPGLLKLANTHAKDRQAKRDQRRDECDYYDPRTGEHWYTRKPLTSRQKLNLEQRYRAGEPKGRILKDMGML